eukprot:TRINITY_DN7294_c0_g1_i2.p1 TRINITY_DN7294_c0_g1~~TRINITY_DN7294_c0_g1_i2.p1  ORF type:complete len:720 (+),score=148.74 TRINITY_DN7294_c0_g1_i2:173-2332(+)
MPWVFACVDAGRLVDTKLFQPSMPYDAQPVQGMSTMIISVTGFEGAERRSIIDTIFQCGAQYTGAMTQKNTHLIFKRPSGDKYRRAQEWGIKCVQLPWLEDTVRNGRVMSEDPYTAPHNSENTPQQPNTPSVSSPGSHKSGDMVQANTPSHSAHGDSPQHVPITDPAAQVVTFAPQPAAVSGVPSSTGASVAPSASSSSVDPARMEQAMTSLNSALATFASLTSDVKQLQTDVAEVRTEARNNARDPEALAAEIRQLRGKVESVRASCVALEDDRTHSATLAAEIAAVRDLVIEYSQKVTSPLSPHETSGQDISVNLDTSGMRSEVEALCERVETNWKADSSSLKSQLQSLNAEVSSLAVQVKASQVQHDSDAKYEEVRADIVAIQERVARLSSLDPQRIATLQDAVPQTQTQLEALTARLTEFDQRSEGLRDRIDGLRRDVEHVTQLSTDVAKSVPLSVDVLQEGQTNLEREIGELRGRMDALQEGAEDPDWKQDIEGKMGKLKGTTDRLDTGVKQVSDAMADVDSRFGQVNEELVQLREQIGSIWSPDPSLLSEVNALSQSVTTVVSDLQQECTRSQQRERELEAKLVILEARLGSLEEVTDNITTLQSQVRGHETRLETLANQVSESARSRAAFAQGSNPADLEGILSSVETINTRLSSFQTRVGRLGDEVDAVGKDVQRTDTRVVWCASFTAVGLAATAVIALTKMTSLKAIFNK